MIAKLRGLVDAVGEDWVVIDVNGVGYQAFCPTRVLQRLPMVGESTTLFIETHVREDHIHLFGFLEAAERAWFRLLSTVPGVGSKVALALLSVLSAEALGQAIVAGDKTALTRAAGVGPKLAQRIAAELKDRAVALGALGNAAPRLALADGPAPAAEASGGSVGVGEDALSALVNLGYGRAEALVAVARTQAALGPEAPLSAVLQAALRELGRN